jgi:hypothetical protein
VDVEVHRLAAVVSTVRALEAGQLAAAMTYGPLPAAAWAVFHVVISARRRLRSLHRAPLDHE